MSPQRARVAGGDNRQGKVMMGLARTASAALIALSLVPVTEFAAAQERPYAGAPYTNEDVIDGFRRTVFGSEYFGLLNAAIVRKYDRPVVLYIDASRAPSRRQAVANFVSVLPRLISGLRLSITTVRSRANFVVHLTPRRSFRAVATQVLEGGRPPATSQCLVVAEFNSSGIQRSDAIIVTDRGEATFERCLREEILQGLGPLNDDSTLKYSLFNDTSDVRRFRRFDRLIMTMLYDPLLRPGKTRRETEQLLSTLLRRAIGKI
ncbi:MAG: DUF2927 domain-containing protein [Pseudomonadota bacterium]